MALAVETGVPHTVWLDDPMAMITAVQILDERAQRMKQSAAKARH